MLARIVSPAPSKFILAKRDFSSEIFISRLSYYITDEELTNAFSAFGKIKDARIIRDPRTNRPKGFAFVNYASELEAQKAVKAMDGRFIGGRLVFVEIAKSKPDDGGGVALPLSLRSYSLELRIGLLLDILFQFTVLLQAFGSFCIYCEARRYAISPK